MGKLFQAAALTAGLMVASPEIAQAIPRTTLTEVNGFSEKLTQLGFSARVGDTAIKEQVRLFDIVNGLPDDDGKLDKASKAAIANAVTATATETQEGITVDLAHQLLIAKVSGNIIAITHVSTGSEKSFSEIGTDGKLHEGIATTPVGEAEVVDNTRDIVDGPLGTYYHPLDLASYYPAKAKKEAKKAKVTLPNMFAEEGIKIHGSGSVPVNKPSSHGCVRVPNYPTTISGDQTFDAFLQSYSPKGTRVHIVRSVNYFTAPTDTTTPLTTAQPTKTIIDTVPPTTLAVPETTIATPTTTTTAPGPVAARAMVTRVS